jgi:tripeptidyl-peptidase-1
MLLKTFSTFLTLSSMTFAIPTSGKYTVKDASFRSSVREKLAGPPPGWVRNGSTEVDKATLMSLRIHLVYQDMDKFHELAMNV